MKVVLAALNSSYTHTNAAVRCLAASLSAAGHTAVIVESTVNDRGGILSFTEKLAAEKAELYGFSVYIWNRAEMFSAAHALKSVLPSCAIVFGGPEVSFEDEPFLTDHPYIDYLIRGEGEEAIRKIADGAYPARSIIDGGLFPDFPQTPEPFFHTPFPQDTDEKIAGKLLYYESSRGCPYACSYCLSSVKCPGEKVRYKELSLVLSELTDLIGRPVRAVKFVDRTFNADLSRAKAIWRHLIELSRSKMSPDGAYTGPLFHFEICGSLLDDESISILSQVPSGLFQFEIGVQSTAPDVLAAIGRRDDTDLLLQNTARLRAETGIKLHLDLIAGLPLDTTEKVRRSFDRIYRQADCLQLGFLKVLPGTRLRRETGKYGIAFLECPPYTVLKTDTMSFEELSFLREFESVFSAYTGEESGFSGSIGYLMNLLPSPFDFFTGLTEVLHGADFPSQKKRYTDLLAYASSLLGNEEQTALLRDHLLLDYLLHEPGTPPGELREEKLDDALRLAVRKAVTDSLDPKAPCCHIPSLETVRLAFDNGAFRVIDRKTKKQFRVAAIGEGTFVCQGELSGKICADC